MLLPSHTISQCVFLLLRFVSPIKSCSPFCAIQLHTGHINIDYSSRKTLFDHCVKRPELNQISVVQTPFQLIRERIFTPRAQRTPFVQRAPFFQDLVIRYVRYAFATFPASIGCVFFSKPVALPFMRFRMLRHGYAHPPLSYTEVGGKGRGFRGVWVAEKADEPVDLVILYVHGGGFSMGSSYFYLEFLMAWLHLLKARYRRVTNPAVLALEYSLVPDNAFPTQVREVRAAYEWILAQVCHGDGKRVVVAGDSAGATLVLSLLLVLANEQKPLSSRPGFATLLSPWCVLVSPRNRNTASDYLDTDTLHMYARQYVSEPQPWDVATNGGAATGAAQRKSHIDSHIASPGLSTSLDLWRRAAPTYGFHFIFGREEVFGPDARVMVKRLREAGRGEGGGGGHDVILEDGQWDVVVTEEEGGIHAWPVVDLFLKSNREERLKGLEEIVEVLGKQMSLAEF